MAKDIYSCIQCCITACTKPMFMNQQYQKFVNHAEIPLKLHSYRLQLLHYVSRQVVLYTAVNSDDCPAALCIIVYASNVSCTILQCRHYKRYPFTVPEHCMTYKGSRFYLIG